MNSLSLITTLMLALSAAIGGGVVAKRLKQPMIIGYIMGGILIGNLVPQFIQHDILELLATGGVTLLLFTLGVEFSFRRLQKILGTIAWAAAAQVAVAIGVFLVVFTLSGFSIVPALFLATAASLSSTAIVVKILSEKGELETLPGEVAAGWLIVQDLSVIPIMLLLPALSAVTTREATFVLAAGTVVGIILKAAVVIVLVLYLGRYGVPKLMNAVASLKSREIFLMVVVGLVFLAALTSLAVGLSGAIGAFLAGLLVAETSQNHAVFAEVRPLRDLFSVVFFVSLGLSLPVAIILRIWPQLVLFTLTIVAAKWFIVMGISRFLGYHRKTSFAVSLALIPMSEFGFILAQEGVRGGALTSDQYQLIVALTFLTIFVGSPLIAHTHGLYYLLHGFFARFPKLMPEHEEVFAGREGLPIQDHIVICGYGRVGSYIGRALTMAGVPFVVVDYNQHTAASLREKGITVVYGDPADRDVLDYAQVDLAKAIVIAIPDRHTQELVIGNAHSLNRRIKIICRTHFEEDQKHLKSLGVQTIVQPEFEAAVTIVEKLLGDFGVASDDIAGKVSRLKIEHGLG